MKKNTILTLFLAVVVSAMSGCAPSEYAYSEWDNDTNDYLDDNEFASAWNDVGYYDNWDTDSDSFLTEDEWNTGVNSYFGDYDTSDYGLFSDWDTDGDGVLNDDEFGVGLYDTVDEDDSDFIEENEYDTWYDNDFGV